MSLFFAIKLGRLVPYVYLGYMDIMKISARNPFKEDIEEFRNKMKSAFRGSTQDIKSEEVTVTIKRDYYPGSFAKLYQNKAILDDLCPEACKVLVYIASHLEYEEELIRINPCNISMEKRKTYKGIMDLIGNRVISKQKKEWYWVNVSLLIVGNIGKHEQQNTQI